MKHSLLCVVLVLGCDAGERPLPPPPPAPPIPVAVALVIEANETTIGNVDYELDETKRYAGTLENLKRGLDLSRPSAAFPAGSQGLVVGYTSGARVIVPPRPLEQLTGATLGDQRDYKGQIGTNVMSGISLAVSELTRINARRRILVVIGYVRESNPEVTRKVLEATQPVRDRLGVELSFVLWHSHDRVPVSQGYVVNGAEMLSNTLFNNIWMAPPPDA